MNVERGVGTRLIGFRTEFHLQLSEIGFEIEFKLGRGHAAALALAGLAPGRIQIGPIMNLWIEMFEGLHKK